MRFKINYPSATWLQRKDGKYFQVENGIYTTEDPLEIAALQKAMAVEAIPDEPKPIEKKEGKKR